MANREQFNLTLRWANDEYETSEDPVDLFCLPSITDTITMVLKDILIRCDLPVALGRGQAYDGASNMQGIRRGFATQIRRENPAALPVHCFGNRLNLCLQMQGDKFLC